MTLALIFDSVSGGEWLVLLAVVLVVVGPRNLPGAARSFGRFVGRLRRMADEFKRQLMSMDEPPPEQGEIPHDSGGDSP